MQGAVHVHVHEPKETEFGGEEVTSDAMITTGIIGGSGLYQMNELTGVEEIRVTTPFGDPSDAYLVGDLGGKKIAFLSRHGRGHRIQPSDINYRANIYGFKKLGVEWLISVSAVGSMKEHIKPLDFVIPDQFSPKDLLNVSRFSFLIGTAAYRPNRPPKAMTASDFGQKGAEAPNVILVGLPAENSITQSANNLLPQPFTEDGHSLEQGYGVYLPTSDQDASLGLMQIMPSPWAQDGVALILSGNDQQGLDWTWDVLLNPTLQNQFAGNVMVVGSAQRSQTFGAVSVQESPQALFQQIADVSNIPIIGSLLQRTGRGSILPAVVTIGVTLLFSIADCNGTLERVTSRAVRICRGRAGLLPIMFFGLGLTISTIGPGGTPTSALLAPPAMAVAGRASIPPFLMAIMAGIMDATTSAT